ncbi:hypothetical protein BJ742DRAFT_433068 [Cladochytrium replicatum]|nr:hypothetical protein BJ742DRAFT_433068 [Cladochytrium replicatum]
MALPLLLLASILLSVLAQSIDVLVPPGNTELIQKFHAAGTVRFACRKGMWRFAGPTIDLYGPQDVLYASVVTDQTGEPVITEDPSVGNGVWAGKRTVVMNSTDPDVNAFQILFEKTESSGTG